MSDQPEPLDLTPHNLPADKTAELLRLFPEIRTEGGQIDFDKLKLVKSTQPSLRLPKNACAASSRS